MKIWIDGDACPNTVKEILFRAARKREVETILVANSLMRLPVSEFIQQELVPAGADEADNYIAEHCEGSDLVITADLPLASAVVEKGGTGLDPRGELYTEENIKERLSMRNFMEEMRFGGLVQGGPASPGKEEQNRFANALDRFLTAGGK